MPDLRLALGELVPLIVDGDGIRATDAEVDAGTEDRKWTTPAHIRRAITLFGPTQFATVAQGAKADTALQPAAIGVTVQAWDAQLDLWATVTPADYLTTAGAAATYQPLDADLTSWAGVTRASGFDTFAATPTSDNLAALVTNETGSGALVFADAPTLNDPVVTVADAATNTTTRVLKLSHTTSGTAAASFGVGMEFETENAAGTPVTGVYFDVVEKDATNGSEDFNVDVYMMRAGAAPVRMFRFNNDGHFEIGTTSLAADNGFRVASSFPQSWEFSCSAANGRFYLFDATNGTIPVFVDPNTPNSTLTIASAGVRTQGSSLSRNPPVTKTADFTVGVAENNLINNKAVSACVVTLPAAASFPGREILIKNIQPFAVNSASSNVVPLAGGAAGTVILTAFAGRWVKLVSDSTNWIAMAGVI